MPHEMEKLILDYFHATRNGYNSDLQRVLAGATASLIEKPLKSKEFPEEITQAILDAALDNLGLENIVDKQPRNRKF